MTLRVGLVGARGHTGRELLRIIANRPDMELAFASSRELAGQAVSDMAPEFSGDLTFEAWMRKRSRSAGPMPSFWPCPMVSPHRLLPQSTKSLQEPCWSTSLQITGLMMAGYTGCRN